MAKKFIRFLMLNGVTVMDELLIGWDFEKGISADELIQVGKDPASVRKIGKLYGEYCDQIGEYRL